MPYHDSCSHGGKSMVNDRGQIYTIEGVTAGIIMIVTAYLVLSTTTIFTPGDVHITDMQLEQTGNDALAMLDSPDSYNLDSVRPNTTALSILFSRITQPDLNRHLTVILIQSRDQLHWIK